MGLLHQKLSSLADACRRLAGCHEEPPPSPKRQYSYARGGHAAIRFPKFPSRQRNFAVRRRRGHSENNNTAMASLGLACKACSGTRNQGNVG